MTKVAPGTSVESAYVRIREGIMDGSHPPGAQLRHSELSEALGLSLIPIREALRRLQVERLVESSLNKGARVSPISVDDLRDVYATRVLVETDALHRAWPRLDAAVVANLRELNAELVRRVEARSTDIYDIHRELHFTIYNAAESAWLLHMIELVWAHTDRYRRLAAKAKPFVDVGDDLHGYLIDAIERRDLRAAKKALRSDLMRTAEVLIAEYGDAAENGRELAD